MAEKHHESAEVNGANSVVSRIVDGVRWGAYHTAKGGVQVSADILGFGVEATGYVAGKAVNSSIKSINNAAKGVMGKKMGQPWIGSKA